MITFEQVKQIIIESETNWLYQVHEDEADEYINMMVDEVSGCRSYSELADWYGMSGLDISEAYQNIIKNVMSKATLIKNK